MMAHARRRLAARLALGLAVLLGGCSKEDTPEGDDDGGTVAATESPDPFVEIEVKTVEGREVHTTARRSGSLVFVTVSEESPRSAVCRVGKKYEFAQQGPRVTVRVDGAPWELAGVVVEKPADVVALWAALFVKPPHMTVWCKARALVWLSVLPEGSELYLTVEDHLSDLAPLTQLPNLRRLELRDCRGVADLAPLRDLQARGVEMELDDELRERLEERAEPPPPRLPRPPKEKAEEKAPKAHAFPDKE